MVLASLQAMRSGTEISRHQHCLLIDVCMMVSSNSRVKTYAASLTKMTRHIVDVTFDNH